MSEVKVTKLDMVNYTRRKVPTAGGEVELEGMTVRCLIKSLQELDPDDLVCYFAENNDSTKNAEVILGCIGAIGGASNCGVTFLFGPEAAKALAAT